MSIDKDSKVAMRFAWGIIFLVGAAFVLSLLIDHGNPFVDFLYWITGGDR